MSCEGESEGSDGDGGGGSNYHNYCTIEDSPSPQKETSPDSDDGSQNHYMAAALAYLVYAIGIILMDYPFYDMDFGNYVSVVSNSIHLINALHWVYIMRRCYTCSWADVLIIPDYLNVVEASLYLYSSRLYFISQDNYDPTTILTHYLETAAAVVELFAAVGWAWQWYVLVQRFPKRGRGLFLTDVELWAQVTIVVGGVVYVVYNVQILLDPSKYGDYLMYMKADWIYLLNAWLYVMAGSRDRGWCGFLGDSQDESKRKLLDDVENAYISPRGSSSQIQCS